MADLIERLDLAISPLGLRDANEELMAEARARIAEMEAEVARLRGCDLIVAHILALVPVREILRVGATGKDLIEWVRAQRDRAALAAPDTGGADGE
ncbi:hypothetical protein [Thauera sp.]|uniref:hypothetical protein n=1 Tax=Thauera sp. TaxID=1905334 RepID=UPI002BCAD825|nr:hypothetical protein [Thauera sp.]HRP25401.1 hypothetical protein [Thauera sp.]